jgi:transcriptional regulator with XRE-family HTH domain
MFSIINSKLTINKTMDNKGIIYYKSIPAEIKKLGLTQKSCADMMGVSLSGLTHRIKADKPQFHLAIYGLATYLGSEADNLQANVQ